MATEKKIAEAKERIFFPFFNTFVEALDNLPDERAELELYRAISHYGAYGDEPQISGLAKTLWTLMRPVMENSRKQYENGAKGGAPKGNKNARKTTPTPPESAEEVAYYCEVNSIDIDPEYFFDYWESRGWNWRNPAVKTWQDAVKKWAEMGEKYGR